MAIYPKDTVRKVRTYFGGSERFGEPLTLVEGWQRKNMLAQAEWKWSAAGRLVVLHKLGVGGKVVLGLYP
jgi:hypothetical protein